MAMVSRNTSAQQHGRDRLSDLNGDLLGTILSFLPNKEAARAAALARRYRHAFAGVNTISFVEQEALYGAIGDDYTYHLESVDKRSMNGELIKGVNGALLCRRRCAGDTNAAPRTFRVHFGCFDEWDEEMVSQWLSYLLRRNTGQELHLDLRLQLTVLGDHNFAGQEWHYRHGGCAYSRYEADRYTLPTRLFSCHALRMLCLGGCSLDPPERIELPFLEMLLLSSIPCADNIQRLISRCPCLVDLTLERCGYTSTAHRNYRNHDKQPHESYTITVLDKQLRRLALRCCHKLVKVSVDASELRAFEYRGAVPEESLLTLQGTQKMSSCTIGFCNKMVYNWEMPRFTKFLEQFAATRQLHLLSTNLGADIESEAFTGFPLFTTLRRLQLTGYLHTGSIEALTRILRRTPHIEILSLFMKQRSRESGWEQWHELGDDFAAVPDVSIPCLRNRLREINLVHYHGQEAQRYAARLLLCNAMVLKRLCVVLPRGPRELQVKLKNEIEGWVVNSSTEIIFF
jgi:hypothetical protein